MLVSKDNFRKIIVYDFGGGTFDVSVLVVTEGKLDVKAVGGDNQLGGDNLDNILMEYCLNEFKKEFNLKEIIGDEGEKAIIRLRAKCEEAKIRLSAGLQTTIKRIKFYDSKDLKVVVTREIFENLIKGLVERSMDITMETLKEANTRPEDVDDIVLVGGTTRIPLIQTELKKRFNNKELNRSVNPDEAVAIGAAIQAAMLNEHQSVPIGKLKLSDVTPLSLGMEVIGRKFSKIIPKNTKFPNKKTKTYYTTSDNQTSVDIVVFEGENDKVFNNNKLSSFTLTGIPNAPLGKQKIEVTFDLNDEGLLHVSAKVVSTGKEGV